MKNRLDQDYGALTLLKFTVPSILSLLCMSLYQMVDSIFISNFIGENALASMNIVFPAFSIILAVVMMFSTGGSAVVSNKMGEGKNREAKEDFTVITASAVGLTVVLTLLVVFFTEPLLHFMGATPVLFDDCLRYLRTLIPFMPVAALQIIFSSFFIAAGKPEIGLGLTVLSGVSNIVLDYVFMGLLHMGIEGAAWGTAIGYLSAGVPGALYFLFNKKGSLHFVKPKIRIKMLGFSCFNGSSEMVSNLSISVTTLLFNVLALRYMGEAGVTAITVALYAQFFLTAVFMGFVGGAGPIFSFALGSHNKKRLYHLFRHSMRTVLLMTGLVVASSYGLARVIVSVYIRQSSPVFQLALHGFYLFSISYLFAGFNIYASGLFTALQNGKISAILSIGRTFVFLLLALLLLPRILGADGIWLAVPVAEFVSALVSGFFIFRYRKKYYFIRKALSIEAKQ